MAILSWLNDRRLFGPYGKAFALLAALIALHFAAATYISVRDVGEMLSARQGANVLKLALLPPILFAIWAFVQCVLRRVERPSRAILHLLYGKRFWLIRSVLLFTLLYPANQAFLTLKVAIPRLIDFYADDALILLDRALFLGNDPWVVSHALFGPFTSLIDSAYYVWFFIVSMATLWATFSSDRRFQIHASLSLFLVWALLGNLLAVALSSVGPIFYDEFYQTDRFSGLIAALDGPYTTMQVRGFLLSRYGIEEIGSGISAAPSIHVAVTALIFLMVRRQFGRSPLTVIAGGYLAVIFVGSVHLAWHYAIDGIISLILVPIIWKVVSAFLTRLERRPVESGNPARPFGSGVPQLS